MQPLLCLLLLGPFTLHSQWKTIQKWDWDVSKGCGEAQQKNVAQCSEQRANLANYCLGSAPGKAPLELSLEGVSNEAAETRWVSVTLVLWVGKLCIT